MFTPLLLVIVTGWLCAQLLAPVGGYLFAGQTNLALSLFFLVTAPPLWRQRT
jgi:hypothetical protein